MTPAQVAGYLQVHKLTVYRYVRERRLPAVRLGRAVRILKSDVDEFLRLNRVPSRSPRSRRAASTRLLTPLRLTQTPMGRVQGHGPQKMVWPFEESRFGHGDPLIWNFWGWIVRGLQ